MRTILLILCFLSVFNFAKAKDVLLIESYSQALEWDQNIRQTLKSVLEPEHRLVSYELKTNELSKKQFSHVAHQAYQIYQQLKPEVVVLADDNAFVYMLPLLYDQPISIVFLGINQNPRELLDTYRGQSRITGILERPLLLRNIGEIGKWLPEDKRKILILFDSGNTGQIVKENMKDKYQQIKAHFQVEVSFVTVSTVSAWQRQVIAAQQNGTGAIIVGVNNRLVDQSGHTLDQDAVLKWTSQHSVIPIFGFWDFMIGQHRAAGGIVISGQRQGWLAGQMIRQILDHGMNANEMPITSDQVGTGQYSISEMARWQLIPPADWTAVRE